MEGLRKELAATTTSGAVTPNVEKSPVATTISLDSSINPASERDHSRNRDSWSYTGSPLMIAASQSTSDDAPEQMSPMMLASDDPKAQAIPSTTALIGGDIPLDALQLPDSYVQIEETKKDI